ncbi:MAG: hypothetical protein HC882_07290 [Acidobacteria bacterium]|nr:hypothetical protein [Acidobacteriota bacterium]
MVGLDLKDLVARCRAQGVLFQSLARGAVRLVTHLDVSREDVERTIDVVSRAAVRA